MLEPRQLNIRIGVGDLDLVSPRVVGGRDDSAGQRLLAELGSHRDRLAGGDVGADPNRELGQRGRRLEHGAEASASGAQPTQDRLPGRLPEPGHLDRSRVAQPIAVTIGAVASVTTWTRSARGYRATTGARAGGVRTASYAAPSRCAAASIENSRTRSGS